MFAFCVFWAQRKIPVDLHFIVRLRHKASGAALGLSCAVCFEQPAGVFLATLFILYRENVLNGTERAFRDVLYRENVLTCTKRVCPALFPLHHPCYVSLRPCPVRTKTFSVHDRWKFRHVVRELGVFTHGKNFHEGGMVALKRHFVLWCARWGWSLWRFASLIPSGWRLPPIHKVMGDHASRGSTPTGLFCHVFSFCVVRKSLLCNKLTFFRVAVM